MRSDTWRNHWIGRPVTPRENPSYLTVQCVILNAESIYEPVAPMNSDLCKECHTTFQP